MGVLLGALMSWGAVALLRFKVTQVSRAELERQLTEWRQAWKDRDELLKSVREEQKNTEGTLKRALERQRELDEEALNLARDLRMEREYCRRCTTILRQHGLTMPPRE